MNPVTPAPEVVLPAEPPVRPPAYQLLADDLRQLITSGQLRPGQRLPTEPELCARSGVSRSTVREALRMLASQNLIITTRGAFGGSFVAQPSAARFAEPLSGVVRLLWAMSTPPAADMCLEIRELLEIAGAGLAAQRRTDSQLTLLTLALPKLDTDLSVRLTAYQDFHGLVAAAVQNPLYELLARPLHRLSAETQLATGSDWELWVDDCRELVARVAAHDVTGAQEAMARHLRNLRAATSVVGPGVG